ncbi:MAG: amidohydrolase family protein [Candidatus Latescibacterota bacterium]|nr:amidohydrolase family protein [Candidatus Latescibacterota bacterium]
MIVDIHTHPPRHREVPNDVVVEFNSVWRPDRPVKVTTCWQDYLDEQAPADRSVVFGVAVDPGGTHGPLDPDWGDGNINDAVAEFVTAHPDRLIGFASVHPFDPQGLEELERCRTELGMKGLKLGANYQNFDPLEPRALALYDEAQRHGLPVMLHQGTSPVRDAPIRYAHPLIVDEIAMRYPELRVIMAHLGHPWQVETCTVIRKHPHVYADLSANFYRPFSFWEQMVKATEWNVLPKILFGTDYPVTGVAETIEHLRKVNEIVEGTPLPKVSLEAMEEIIHRDSLKLLGIKQDQRAS